MAREKSPEELAILERLRTLCRALPGAEESVDGHGHTSFRVGGRPFVMMGSMRLWLGIKADPISQDALVRSGRWTRGQGAWTSPVDYGALDWEEIGEMLRDAWQITAPKRLLRTPASQPPAP